MLIETENSLVVQLMFFCCFSSKAILFMSLANGKSTLRMSPLTRGAKAVLKAIESFTEVVFV